MDTRDVGLLDVVPWTHGYVHSWALRWMLRHDQLARDALLDMFVGDRRRPWAVDGTELEHRVGRHRADLRVEATDAAGRALTVLIETKVNDALSESQINTYCSEPAEVVLYGPGLTGLLLSASEPVARERWITGAQLAAVLSDVDLPDLLRGYLDEVEAQASRMQEARAAARGDQADFPREPGISGVSGDDVEAVAWIAEVATAMRVSGAEGVQARNTRHDYGIFWSDSWRAMPGFGGAGVYVDVIAAHGRWEYALTVKVGDGTVEDRLAVFDAAMGLDGPGDGWEAGRRRRSESFRLWKRDAGEMPAGKAADAVMQLDDYLEALVSAAGQRART